MNLTTRPFFSCTLGTLVFVDNDFYVSTNPKPISMENAVGLIVRYMTAKEALPVDIRCCIIKTIPGFRDVLVASLKKELHTMQVTRGMTWNGMNKPSLEKYFQDVITHLTEDFPDND